MVAALHNIFICVSHLRWHIVFNVYKILFSLSMHTYARDRCLHDDQWHLTVSFLTLAQGQSYVRATRTKNTYIHELPLTPAQVLAGL
jgi:hypothetical protein